MVLDTAYKDFRQHIALQAGPTIGFATDPELCHTNAEGEFQLMRTPSSLAIRADPFAGTVRGLNRI
jgi:hypothetical protein